MKYRPEIDGLRALAVVPVILFHAGFDWFSGGFVGVDIFFVISGYLITTILVEDLENDRFSIINFYERRARRILPALFFVTICCIPFAWMWMAQTQLKEFSNSIAAVSLFVSNFLFMSEAGYFATAANAKPLLHTWSLAVEEQYYLVAPIFLYLTWRFGKTSLFWMIVGMAMFSFALSEWGAQNIPDKNFYLTPMRTWELLAGAITAFYLLNRGAIKNNLLSILGVAAIVISIHAYDESIIFPSAYTLIPVIGTVLIIAFTTKETLVGKLLSSKTFVGMGLISYSAYLWHQPLFAFANIRFFGNTNAFLMIGLSILSILLAVISWRFIERPFRRNGERGYSRTFIFSFSAVGVITLISTGLIGVYNDGFPERFPILNSLKPTDSTSLQRLHECFLLEPTDVSFDKDCTAETEYKRRVLLVGDSHAASVYPGLSAFLEENKIKLDMLAVGRCFPLVLAYPESNKSNSDSRCLNINQQVLSQINSNRYDLILISEYMWGWVNKWGPLGYPNYYSDFLSELKNVSKSAKTIVIGQFPIWLPNLTDLVSDDVIQEGYKQVSNIPEYSSKGLPKDLFAFDDKYGIDVLEAGAEYISTIDHMCTADGCARFITKSGRTALTSSDYGHLSLEASVYYAENIIGPRILGELKK